MCIGLNLNSSVALTPRYTDTPACRAGSVRGTPRYAHSNSTLSEAAESGVVKGNGRRAAFADDDDDETLTQSMETVTLRSNR